MIIGLDDKSETRDSPEVGARNHFFPPSLPLPSSTEEKWKLRISGNRANSLFLLRLIFSSLASKGVAEVVAVAVAMAVLRRRERRGGEAAETVAGGGGRRMDSFIFPVDLAYISPPPP